MIATDGLYILKQRFVWVRRTDWWISYIRAIHHVCRAHFLISGSVSSIHNLFMHLRLTVLRKHLTGDYRQMFTQNGFVLYAWRSLSAPLEWCHSNLIALYCNLYVSNIFNWWLSSKDMKLQVLIKEALVVFHWLTFRIMYIYIYIYIYI